MKSEIQSIETKTLEEVLLELRTKNNWTYLNIMDKLNEKGKYVEEKIIKKWEIGLIYPTTDELYLLSEIYMYPVTNLIQAKTNSYKKGMDAIHYRIIKWFCYITGASMKVSIVAVYIFLLIAFIFSVKFFIDCANMFWSSR